MSENRNGKIKLWVYAVVLFTSAFIVLLITAFSQFKFNKSIQDYRKSIEEYRSQISNKENEKNKFLVNLNSALDQNAEMKQDIEKMSEELKELKSQVQELEIANSKLLDEQNHARAAYENLLLSASEYKKGDVRSSAERLFNYVNPALLNEEGLAQYRSLVANTYRKAARELYLGGYGAYKKKDYLSAVGNFKQSLKFSGNEYFVDDCYYFLAVSEYRLGNKESARGYFETLVAKFPSGVYAKSAAEYLEKLKNPD